jgi:hypothetical protein
MLHCVALVRTNVSEERAPSIIRVARLGDLGTTSTVTSNFLRSVLRLLVTDNFVTSSPILVTLMMEATRSSETYVLTIATLRNRRENLKSY